MINLFNENPQVAKDMKNGEVIIFGVVLLFGVTILFAPLAYAVYLAHKYIG